MAKRKLTQEALDFVIETYECRSKNYTFSDIATMLEKNFDIEITVQAVHQHYHRDKKRKQLKNRAVVSSIKKVKTVENTDNDINMQPSTLQQVQLPKTNTLGKINKFKTGQTTRKKQFIEIDEIDINSQGINDLLKETDNEH